MIDDVLLFTGNYTWAEIRGEYSRVTFSFHIRRKPRYYIINLITPCCLLSFVTAAAFILPSTCSERLAISTYMLVACTQGVHRTPGLLYLQHAVATFFSSLITVHVAQYPSIYHKEMTLAATRWVSRFLMCPKMHLWSELCPEVPGSVKLVLSKFISWRVGGSPVTAPP